MAQKRSLVQQTDSQRDTRNDDRIRDQKANSNSREKIIRTDRQMIGKTDRTVDIRSRKGKSEQDEMIMGSGIPYLADQSVLEDAD